MTTITLHESSLLGFCLVTQELLDHKKFILNFCDGVILKSSDTSLKQPLVEMKKELNSFKVQKKFLDGYKAILLYNMDRILNMTVSRFAKVDPKSVEKIVESIKSIMKKVSTLQDFDSFSGLDAEFKKKVTLPIYELYIKSEKAKN